MHKLRETIKDDLQLFLMLATPEDQKRIDQILGKLASAIYPMMKNNAGILKFHGRGTLPAHINLICSKCKKYDPNIENLGDGILCPKCREKSSYKPKYQAKLMFEQFKPQSKPVYLCEVKGETIPDLWANATTIAKEKGFSYYKDSRFWNSTGNIFVNFQGGQLCVDNRMEIRNGTS